MEWPAHLPIVGGGGVTHAPSSAITFDITGNVDPTVASFVFFICV